MLKLILNSLCLSFVFLSFSVISAEETSSNEVIEISFKPPEGWRLADSSALPKAVKRMVVGKGEHEFPPSINLGTDQFNGNLQDYLKLIRSINESQGTEWKDLGLIRTEAGDASLSQITAKTQWGNVKMMHTILVRDGTVYILTAAALQEEFPKFYKDFFASMRSLKFNKG